jgi:hypothetical protein
MSDDPKLNEWKLLRDQFDARVREDSDIEVIFDAEFRRRFTELINQVIEPERTDHDARFWKSADLRRLHQ